MKWKAGRQEIFLVGCFAVSGEKARSNRALFPTQHLLSIFYGGRFSESQICLCFL
ncbi:hypothetical protein CLOSTMETH_00315 [[Clostridium] methylpentosum DSM 5476]|uniref:Uncharacterized protein n=1 Tax=[Clostridium] methylpentosum DSM 5476 TaxID=537013 RepID=C0E920_9FIRM|nr:hypothetical protein CLOSTMETH_00315 [[Clostridium] methylpentosum DSM 5476]